MRLFLLAFLFQRAAASAWVRGNYTTLTITDDLSGLTLSAGNLLYSSAISPAPSSSQDVSGSGVWGAYDELKLLDAQGDLAFGIRYYSGVDAFSFERVYDNNATTMFPLFVPVTTSVEISLLAWAESYMLSGHLIPSLDVCAGSDAPSHATASCNLTGVVSCSTLSYALSSCSVTSQDQPRFICESLPLLLLASGAAISYMLFKLVAK